MCLIQAGGPGDLLPCSVLVWILEHQNIIIFACYYLLSISQWKIDKTEQASLNAQPFVDKINKQSREKFVGVHWRNRRHKGCKFQF